MLFPEVLADEIDDEAGIVECSVGVGLAVQALGRGRQLIVTVEADLALPAKPPGNRHEALDLAAHGRRQALGVLGEDDERQTSTRMRRACARWLRSMTSPGTASGLSTQ